MQLVNTSTSFYKSLSNQHSCNCLLNKNMMKNSLGSNKIRGVFELIRLYRSKPMVSNPSESSVVVAASRPSWGSGFGSVQLAGLRFVHANATSSSSSSMANDGKQPISPMTPKSPPPRPPSPPRRGGFPKWVKLVLGSVFSLLLAIWTPKWATLLKLGGEAEVVIKDAEQVAEVVEKVAAVMEKVSEELADSLPDGNQFKETALIIDHISKEAAKDAQIADEILHKIDVVKQDVDVVEEMIEPIIDEIEHRGKTSNEQANS